MKEIKKKHMKLREQNIKDIVSDKERRLNQDVEDANLVRQLKEENKGKVKKYACERRDNTKKAQEYFREQNGRSRNNSSGIFGFIKKVIKIPIYAFGIMFILAIIGSFMGNDVEYSDGKVASVSKEFVEEDYASIGYDEIARNPKEYVGSKVKYTGEVVQVMEKGKELQMRVNVTKGEYIYEDTVFVMYDRSSESESRILEKDIVTIYGESDDLISYKSAIGSWVTIPKIKAHRIDIENE